MMKSNNEFPSHHGSENEYMFFLGDSLNKNILKTIAKLFNEESIHFEVFQKISTLKCIAAIKRSSLK